MYCGWTSWSWLLGTELHATFLRNGVIGNYKSKTAKNRQVTVIPDFSGIMLAALTLSETCRNNPQLFPYPLTRGSLRVLSCPAPAGSPG